MKQLTINPKDNPTEFAALINNLFGSSYKLYDREYDEYGEWAISGKEISFGDTDDFYERVHKISTEEIIWRCGLDSSRDEVWFEDGSHLERCNFNEWKFVEHN